MLSLKESSAHEQDADKKEGNDAASKFHRPDIDKKESPYHQ